jgi:hypothetical protein
VLGEDFGVGAFKGTLTTEPFVDDDAESILVAGGTCVSLNLFWGHVGNCANGNLHAHGRGAVGSRSNAKIAEQDVIALANEHVFGLDIAVNELLIMGIPQSVSDLLHIGNYGQEWDVLAFGMTFPQCAMRTIVHQQEWDTIGDIKVQDTYDVRMHKLGNRLGLLLKPIDLFV